MNAESGTLPSNAPFGLALSMAVFDRATRLTRTLFPTGFASIILVHNGEIWRSRYAGKLPEKDTMTEAILAGGTLFWIEDGRTDPRYADHPWVVGPPFLRFTAAAPIRLQDGSTPGVLSVSALEPQPFDARKAARLQDIADFLADEWARARTVAALEQSLRERDEALARLERSEATLKIALTLADIHVWELDFKRRELIKSGAADTFFSEPPTFESLHKDIRVVVDPRDRDTVRAAWTNGIQNGLVQQPEFRINRSDGREIWAQSAVKFFMDEAGQLERMVGALKNVTARKQAEKALLDAKEEADAANKAKGDFLATMSHELRTPLTSILGFSELLREQPDISEQSSRFIDRVVGASRVLLSLVNDILDFSKIEMGKVEITPQAMSPAALCAAVLELIAPQADAKGLQRAFQADGGIPHRVLADAGRLQQILLNLLGNAAKFTETGEIVLRMGYAREAQRLRFVVSDSGPGIAPEGIARLFRRFSQIDGSTTRSHGGTGLGLAICKGLVDAMGGEIGVHSELDRGSDFWFEIPAPPAEDTAADAGIDRAGVPQAAPRAGTG